MKFAVLILMVVVTAACASDQEPKLPYKIETAVDSDLLILKTEDARVVDVRAKRIAYEYNDRHIKLAQLGEHARRFCEGKGRDTVLVDMVLTNKHNFRRATFECQTHPVLVPKY